MHTPIRAIIFDVGGTLWFQAHEPDPRLLAQFEAARVQPLLDRWAINLDEPLDDLLIEIWDAYMTADSVEGERGTFREPSLPFLIRGALAVRGIVLTEQQAEAWWRASWISERHFGVQLYPDTLDVLAELRQLSIRIGINTTRPCTAEMHLPGLHDMGIGRYVDAAVCSGDTGFRKPHPSVFERILRLLDVAPDEAIMVGDDCASDIAGGHAAGMRTIWKLNGRYGAPPCADADYTIHELSELLALPLFDRPPAALVSIESLTPHEDGNADRY